MPNIDLFPLRLSIQVSLVATTICFIVGLALAWVLARHRFWGQNLLEALVILPLVLPPTVIGYYLLQILGRQTAIGRFIEGTFGLTIAFSWLGAAIASAIVAFPLMVRSAQAALEGIDPALEQVARTLGRSNVAIFFTITLPLAWRGVLAGTVLTFARAMGEFGATVMVAGNIPNKTQTMPVAIFDAWQAGDVALTNTLTIILTVTSILSIAFFTWLIRLPRW